ncbi:MAG: aminotransferase class I/II-fold pyridoxal phosphate-dependent enzyme [Desulfitobacteriia bacterium]
MDSLRLQLAQYTGQRMLSFHTPGHKGRNDLLSPIAFPSYDLTELPGLDMLHNPQGVLAEAQKQAALVYGAEETFFLVNGATVGNQAMFLSLRECSPGKKVRVERSAHRSVISGLILSGLEPEYIPPLIHPEFELPLGVDLQKYCSGQEDLGALHLTTPSYYGTLSDLEGIIQWRNKNFPQTPILVDQAHGAHLEGHFFPRGAVAEGADLVVHSTHKTLAALTQAAMLHVQGPRINRQALKQSLEILQTSSPSYLMMLSLENALNHWQRYSWADLYQEVMLLQKKLKGFFRFLTVEDIGYCGIKNVDWTKILVNTSSLDISALEVVRILRSSFRIEPELWDENNILFLLGIGSRPEEVRELAKALERIAKHYGLSASGKNKRKKRSSRFNSEVGQAELFPPLKLSPREAWLAPKRVIKVKDSLGQVAGETISIYPPGIPLVAIGEEINPWVLSYLEQAEDYQWQGWQGFKRGEILVVDI